MKLILKLFLLIFPFTIVATPQDSEILIYQGNTLYIDYYPLEKLKEDNIELSKKLKKFFPGLCTACGRGYHGTWKIVNDSLFLIKIESDGWGHQEVGELDLSILFSEKEITPNGIFAYWYTHKIHANYGDFLDSSDDELALYNPYPIYSGLFYCTIKKGVVSNIRIDMKSQSEIDAILKARMIREDTMLCYIIERMPQPVFDSKKYNSIEDFIQKNLRYPKGENSIEGRVFVQFIVEKDGSISNLSIAHGLSTKLDNEALRVVSLIKKWKPGKSRDKFYRVSYTIAVEFKAE